MKLDILSLWSVTEILILKNTCILDQGLLPALYSGKLYHHSILFMQDRALYHIMKDKGLVGKKDKIFTMVKLVAQYEPN